MQTSRHYSPGWHGHGPQIIHVGDWSFSHDSQGRMVSDGLASRFIDYNYMGLPRKVGRFVADITYFSYLAGGMKTGATNISTGAGLLYRGPMVYKVSSGGALTLDGAAFGEGRLTPAGVRYHVCDRLGSVKAVVDGVSGAFYSAKDYSAYGAESVSSTVTTSPSPAGETYREGFTGQEELEPDFGLPYTDFGARHYAPSIRRWLTPDPLSEKYYDISPYVYCADNPVNLVDPEGMIFTERSQPYVDQYEQVINDKFTQESSRVDELLYLLDQAKSARQAKRIMRRIERRMTKMSELINAAGELAVLKMSSQVYDVYEEIGPSPVLLDSNGDPISIHGELEYNRITGNIDVKLYEGNRIATIAHEFKHLYQFEKGETGFSYFAKKGTPYLHDNQDEVEAFSRGRLFNGEIMPSHYFSKNLSLSQRVNPQTPPFLLQTISSSYRIVFRVKGKTYVPSRP